NQLRQLDVTSEEANTIIQGIVNCWFKVRCWIESSYPMNPKDICRVGKETVIEQDRKTVRGVVTVRNQVTTREVIYNYWPQPDFIKVISKEKDGKGTMDLGIRYRLV